jgi:hypothetical protein
MQELKITFRDLEKNVCSRKWAERLKEIGVRQDTYFHWIYDKKNEQWDVGWSDYFDEDDFHCSAFTVQDFIDLFPRLFKFSRNEHEWNFYCEYADIHLEDEENLANVFARILIAITKNKTQVNKPKLILKRLK